MGVCVAVFAGGSVGSFGSVESFSEAVGVFACLAWGAVVADVLPVSGWGAVWWRGFIHRVSRSIRFGFGI